MITKKTARQLLIKYQAILEKAQQVIDASDQNISEDYKKIIPETLAALEAIAESKVNRNWQQIFKNTIRFGNFNTICTIASWSGIEEVNEFYTVAKTLVEHPNDKHCHNVKSAYSHFFKNTLTEIAFYPYVSCYRKNKGDDRGYTGMFVTAMCAIPLIIPTLVTLSFGLVVAVLAALTAPFALGGACIVDLFDNEGPEARPLTI